MEIFNVTCHICGKKLKEECYLKNHIKYFHNTPISECTVCGKKVKKIKLHMKTMHGDANDLKYQCNKCGKRFIRPEILKKHDMSVHLKLRPYECRYGCDMRYNEVSNRNQHEKKTHGKLFEIVNESVLYNM